MSGTCRRSMVTLSMGVMAMLFAACLSCVPGPGGDLAAADLLPNFVGMPLQQAMDQARAKQLVPEVYSTPQPTADRKLDGIVASQYPAAGQPVTPSRRITLTPYKYSAAVTESVVPNVVGATLDKSRAALAQQGFAMYVFASLPTPDRSKADTIIKQDPAPGTKLARGQTVTVDRYEYHARENAPVPNVVGMTVAEARAALLKAEFSHVNVSGGDGRANVRVTGQLPTAGQFLSTFEIVVLYTTRPKTQRVPQLIDMKITDAVKKVVEAGLTPRLEVTATDPRPGPPRLGGGTPPVRRGIVLQQRPAPGETLAEDESVYLVYIPSTQ